MDTVITALLFVAFVPGVVVTIPSRSDKYTVLAVHAVLFALATTLCCQYYWDNVRGFIEGMGNYGAKCPNGYRMTEDENCVPAGHTTYKPSA